MMIVYTITTAHGHRTCRCSKAPLMVMVWCSRGEEDDGFEVIEVVAMTMMMTGLGFFHGVAW